MKKILISIISFIFFINYSFGQYPDQPNKILLKEYSSYVHKFELKSCWKYKFKIENGLVVQQENYCNNELRMRTKFEYDDFDNVIIEIYEYDFNDGKTSDTLFFHLTYEKSRLVEEKYGFSHIKYSNFTHLGKPKLVEYFSEINIGPYKEILDYDESGNVIKKIEFKTYTDLNDNTINEKATTYFKYDKWNNVVEIHREFEPKQDFPIIMIGGPSKYEFEYFRYQYNKNGLWTKLYKTVNGEEFLIATREYK